METSLTQGSRYRQRKPNRKLDIKFIIYQIHREDLLEEEVEVLQVQFS